MGRRRNEVRQADRALELLSDGRVWTPEMLREGSGGRLSLKALRRLVEADLVDNPERGIYRRIGAPESEWDTWAQVAVKEPEAVFILLSAAAWHGLTQENPGRIWIGIPMRVGHPPRMGDFFPGFECLRWRNPANHDDRDPANGIERVAAAGAVLRITSPERTVVDMWRYSVLNPSCHPRARRISEETCYDCMQRYLERHGNFDGVLAAADRFGVREGMEPCLRPIQHVASRGPAP